MRGAGSSPRPFISTPFELAQLSRANTVQQKQHTVFQKGTLVVSKSLFQPTSSLVLTLTTLHSCSLCLPSLFPSISLPTCRYQPPHFVLPISCGPLVKLRLTAPECTSVCKLLFRFWNVLWSAFTQRPSSLRLFRNLGLLYVAFQRLRQKYIQSNRNWR